MTITISYYWDDDYEAFDGIGTITIIGTFAQQNTTAVVVDKTALVGGGFEYKDNRGHVLTGIEAINTTGAADRIEVDYSIAEQDMLASGYLVDIRTYGGKDVVRVGDTMPVGDPGHLRLGAKIVGGAGDDDLTGGSQNDLIKGDAESYETWKGNDILRGGAGNDTIYGQLGSDTIFGGNGDDYLVGDLDFQSGKDRILGGKGADLIELGYESGSDTVVINSVAESTSAKFDTIKDFASLVDTLDLSSIDANTSKSGNQAFRLTGAWTNNGGELVAKIEHSTADGDRVILLGDTGFDNVADLKIILYVNDDWVDLQGLRDCLTL
ncbi:MAG: hypothetical protein RLZZ444_593 [Pseudomonadota bacterium]|jgi:Ca2+-binding RTX toxin-like protein